MKKIMILVCCVLLVFPMIAQDTCDFDLSEVTKTLIDAQSAERADDNETALSLVADAQEQLAAITENCAGDSAGFAHSYTSPDEKISFRYPDGWVFDNVENEVFFVADSVATTQLVEDSDPVFPSGAQLLFVWQIEHDGEANLDQFTRFFLDEYFDEDWQLSGPIERTTVADIDARAATLKGLQVETKVIVLDIEPEAALIIGGFSAPDELDELVILLDEFIQTVRYRNILVPQQFESSTEATAEETETTDAGDVAPPLDLNYSRAVLIDQIIGGDVSRIDLYYSGMLSPDGTMVAWFDRDDLTMCVFTFETSSTDCTPSNGFDSVPTTIRWSPNSAYIAFHEDLFIRFEESDIWVFDVAKGEITNMTDDGVIGNLLRPPDDGDTPLYDYVPAWHPDGSLYFLRTIRHDRDNYEQTIQELNIETGEVELVKDISNYFEYLTIYPSQEQFLDGPISFSPDGTQMAVVLRPREIRERKTGIWLIDLTDDSAPTQLLSHEDYRTWYPSDAPDEYYVFPYAIAWSPDGAGIYVHGSELSSRGMSTRQLFYVEVASGDITPFTDFSGLTLSDIGGNPDVMFDMPNATVMIPNTGQVVIGNRFRREFKITSEDGEVLYQIGEDEGEIVPAYTASASNDGKVLMFGYLFMPEE